MTMRSNMFANIENKFEFADKDEITEIALNSFAEIFQAMESMSDQVKFSVMIVGAKVGVAGNGVLNQKEEELINTVIGNFWNGPMDEIYNVVASGVEENDYNFIEKIIEIGNSLAMPFLYYTLSFAYIDGNIDDEVAHRLDGLYGMTLLTEFIQSGQEEVPAPSIRITGLEAEIVSWFKEEDTLHPLKEIQSHFSGRSHLEIQRALDSLVEKGILYGGANFIGNMYGLS